MNDKQIEEYRAFLREYKNTSLSKSNHTFTEDSTDNSPRSRRRKKLTRRNK